MSSQPQTSDVIRCISAGMGSILQGGTAQGDSGLFEREGTPHQLSRVKGSKTCDFVFSSHVSTDFINPHSNGQYSSSNISYKDGRNQERSTDRVKQRNLGISVEEHQITITVEYLPGILNVEADKMSRNVKDSQRVEDESTDVSKYLSSKGGLPPQTCLHRDCLIKYPIYFFMEGRSLQQGTRCLSNMLGHIYEGMLFHPSPLIGRVYMESQIRQSHNFVSNSSMANTVHWYPQLLQLSVKNPILLPTFSQTCY